MAGTPQKTSFPTCPKEYAMFARFTKTLIAFHMSEGKLLGALKHTYGDSMTINRFEKMCRNYHTMKIDQFIQELYNNYVTSREKIKKFKEEVNKSIAPTCSKEQFAKFAKCTKKQVAFHKSEKELSEALNHTYGGSVSISYYEKMLVAYPTMKKELQDLIYIDSSIQKLYKSYVTSREKVLNDSRKYE